MQGICFIRRMREGRKRRKNEKGREEERKTFKIKGINKYNFGS